MKTANVPSPLEAAFTTVWTIAGNRHRKPESEYRFNPDRQWRFDFAWPSERVTVELEGGAGTGGRHTRRAGFQADAEKYNAAAELGWIVLRYTGADLRKRPMDVVEQVRRVIASRSDG